MATKKHTWNYENVGGSTRVKIATGADIAHLGELDPKKWTVLSCPATGLEIDEKSLKYVDTDNDGRIRVNDIVATAKTCLGVPYVWGGESMSGFDCSGLVYYVFEKNGITLGRTCKKQYTAGTPISKSKLQPGDLVFFQNTYTTGLSHVGIYIGGGSFVADRSSAGTIGEMSIDSSYYTEHFVCARRYY